MHLACLDFVHWLEKDNLTDNIATGKVGSSTMFPVHVQCKVGKYEAEMRQEAQLVRQVAEASLTMTEALSSAGQARDVTRRVTHARSRASHNRSSAHANRMLVAEKTELGRRLQREAEEVSLEAQRLRVHLSISP